MDDNAYGFAKERVMGALDRWRGLLGLNDWQIECNFLRASTSRADEGAVISVNSKWQYEHAMLDVYCLMLEHRTDDEVSADVLHELLHLLVAPMARDDAESPTREQLNLEELTVTRLTRAVLRVAGEPVAPLHLVTPKGAAMPTPLAELIVRVKQDWPSHAGVHEEGACLEGCERCDLEQHAAALWRHEMTLGGIMSAAGRAFHA